MTLNLCNSLIFGCYKIATTKNYGIECHFINDAEKLLMTGYQAPVTTLFLKGSDSRKQDRSAPKASYL